MVTNGEVRPNVGLPDIEERIERGRVFSVRRLWEGVADGNARNIVVTNPANSDTDLLTVAPNFASSAGSFAEKIENPTIDTPGSSVGIQNKSIESNRSPNASAETGGTYSGGTSRGKDVVGSSAGGGGAGGAVGQLDLALRIPPDNTVQYRLESNAASNNMSIAITFIEEPIQ